MILGHEGLISLGIVGRKFERHDTESTAPFTFDNATPPLARRVTFPHPLAPRTARDASCGLLGPPGRARNRARAPERGDLPARWGLAHLLSDVSPPLQRLGVRSPAPLDRRLAVVAPIGSASAQRLKVGRSVVSAQVDWDNVVHL